MVGFARLQNGHSKSDHATIVTNGFLAPLLGVPACSATFVEPLADVAVAYVALVVALFREPFS